MQYCAILRNIVQSCAILCNVVQYCATLCNIVQCCAILCHIVQFGSNFDDIISPERASGAPEIESKSVHGPPRDAPWRPRASQGRLGSILGARQRVPGAPGSARRVPKGAPGRPNGRPGAPGSAPRRPKSTPDRVREQQTRVSCVRLGREALPEQLFVEFRKPRTLKK